MALKAQILKQLRSRDDHCWHCGATDDYLVPHHRINRGSGGSKRRENDITNLMLICAYWNGIIEAQATQAMIARSYGHKLRSWQETTEPAYDAVENKWYVLCPEGNKIETNIDQTTF